jgi:hypothetical protein
MIFIKIYLKLSTVIFLSAAISADNKTYQIFKTKKII